MNRNELMGKLNLSNRSRIYVFVLAIIIRIFLTLLEQYYDYYLIGKHTKSIFYLGLIFLAIKIIKPTDKIVKLVFYIFIGFLCLWISTIILLNSSANQFYYYSPNKETKMIIDENSYLVGSIIDVYEGKYYIFMRKINNAYIDTDNGYRPFKDGEVSFNWINEREVIIKYRYRFLADIWRTAHIKFD